MTLGKYFFSKFFPKPLSVQEMAELITWRIAERSFKIFKSKKMRSCLKFDSLEQTEQDRIFNEFVVTGIALAQLMMESLSRFGDGARAAFMKGVGENIAAAYSGHLKSLGIEQKHLKIWKKLMEMRRDEYWEDWLKYRDRLPPLDKGNPWISVVATGALFHLRRGKTSIDDPLHKEILFWAGNTSDEISTLMRRSISRM